MYEPSQRYAPPAGIEGIPTCTRWLLISNVAVFLLMTLTSLGPYLFAYGALFPTGGMSQIVYQDVVIRSTFQPWQVLTYGWLHGGIGHLVMNMFGVFMFGSVIERVWGQRRFFVYYLVCIVGAAVTQLLLQANGPTVGASGGLFGLLLAFGLMFPNQPLLILFVPVPVKAKWAVLGYGAVELFFGLSGQWSGVAHFAHLGGMVSGLLLLLFWTNRLPVKPRPGKLW